jgi:transposase
MNATTKPVVGVDTAKNVFQLYSVDTETGEVINKQLAQPVARAVSRVW